MNAKIKSIIKQYAKEKSFTYVNADDDMIKVTEKELKVSLPQEYKEFLIEYGHGGLEGVEILGIALDGRKLFVDETMRFRQYGLPSNYVVVENCDEWLYCIDCNTEKIVFWDRSGFTRECYNTFDDFLIDRFNDSIENM